MKIVVIGGTGLIGAKLVELLRKRGHEAIPGSPENGINSLTGEGLRDALAGAQTVVDVANSPSFEDAAVLEFFERSSRNLLAAESVAGVKHHVALSIVGADRLPDSGYLRAKVVQENLIQASGIPYSILRSTQFAEFMGRIAQAATQGDVVRLPSAYVQPVVSDDVVAALADIALDNPVNGRIEIAGPEKFRLDDLVRRVLVVKKDARKVISDQHARYFGTELGDDSLVPLMKSRLGATKFETWLGSPLK